MCLIFLLTIQMTLFLLLEVTFNRLHGHKHASNKLVNIINSSYFMQFPNSPS